MILSIDANYLNEIKHRLMYNQDEKQREIQRTAIAEGISTYILGRVAYKIEQEKLKLEASRKPITATILELIKSKYEYHIEEGHQIRTTNEQGQPTNVIIHITLDMKITKQRILELQKKDENRSGKN
ncbi:hypothetical protein ABPG72_021722 [Tetrahymena utriculariae]